MTHFILNEREIHTGEPAGTPLLDFIRSGQHLTGTKIGCREGDCGACTVLVGELSGGELHYASATSCLMPLGNANGKHIVTIEGINGDSLTPVQEAMAEEGATQCGFCTPGFVVSLTGYALSATSGDVRSAVDGNICRCTGYKSIERAAERINRLIGSGNRSLNFAVEAGFVPAYFIGIRERLIALRSRSDGRAHPEEVHHHIGGGTDLYVQQHDTIREAALRFHSPHREERKVEARGDHCVISGSATVSDLLQAEWLHAYLPGLRDYIRLVSSTPIRNMATLAGNFINASPIGDFSIFFLALDAELLLAKPGGETRVLPLRQLYQGYKKLNKSGDEYIQSFRFLLPSPHTRVHFEKVSKRTHLDIASVNSAICLQVEGERITAAGLSAGGVAPVPLYLDRTSAYLVGKAPGEVLVREAIAIAQSEITPISDARGSSDYKKLLLGQLIKAHFIRLFPQLEASVLLNPAQ